jgi:hypothetical protein
MGSLPGRSGAWYDLAMPFLTLHELSLQFDIPVRVLRYRLRQLLQENKLVEGDDYRRDDFVDETHFVWKINPASFIRLTGAKPVPNLVTQVGSKLGNEPQPLATSSSPTVNQPANQPLPKPEPVVTQTPPPLPNVAPKPAPGDAVPELAREMITVLKEQVKVKDGQIADLTARVREVSETNVKLIGATLQQAKEIHDLLRLGSGPDEGEELATKEAVRATNSATKPTRVVNQDEPTTTKVGNEPPPVATNLGNQTDAPAAQAA